jgi:DNA-binding protein H-NS
MTDLNQLIEQRNAIEKQIGQIKEQERSKVVAQVRELVKLHDLKAKDIFGKGGAGSKLAAKYRDPESGATWTGRGKAPKWLEGKDKAAYQI